MQSAPKKAFYNQLLAIVISILTATIFLSFVWQLRHQYPEIFYILVAIALLVSYNCYSIFTSKYRNRAKVLETPFPKKWRILLHENVAYYHTLSDEEKNRFERKVQIFLSEIRITGIKTDIDDKIRLLVASSAIIPIFGFNEWEYDNLGEVLIYPSSFDKDYNLTGKKRNILGMVGTGPMDKIMIFSKQALLQGFMNNKDNRNVGIHEFAHLVDSGDGYFDGIPPSLPHKYVQPWLDLMYKEIERIKANDSSLNPYGATNRVEFFAVATEYFFEHPFDMEKENPELYDMLELIFNQDTAHKFSLALKSVLGYKGRKIGRNAKCPCKSGNKYKHCCLKG